MCIILLTICMCGKAHVPHVQHTIDYRMCGTCGPLHYLLLLLLLLPLEIRPQLWQ